MLHYSLRVWPFFLTLSARTPRALQLHAHALDVLTCCLEELEVIPVALLDAFLLFLLPSARHENATAYQIVQVKTTNKSSYRMAMECCLVIVSIFALLLAAISLFHGAHARLCCSLLNSVSVSTSCPHVSLSSARCSCSAASTSSSSP